MTATSSSPLQDNGIMSLWRRFREADFWYDEENVPARVTRFRAKATRLLLFEQWAMLLPVALTAYFTGNSWMGLLVVGILFHGATTFFYRLDPIGLSARSLIATGLLLDVLLLIYALSGTGSWQMDGGHMWVFAVWSHALGLLCWRSLLISGTLGVFHHLLLVGLFPLWVFPDGANMWRVLLHAGVVLMQLSALCVFVFLIKHMLTEAQKLETALAESLVTVREVSSSKSRFLAHMSHELRTPLNAIIGFSDVMHRQIFGELSPRYLDYARNIHASGAHLHDLINDVLDLSRIESGKHEIFTENIEPAEIVRNCVAMVSDRARAAEIDLPVLLPANLPLLAADARAVKQVLLNLLSNAIKYTPAGGSATTRAEVTPAGLVLTVTDTGMGISPHALKSVFEPFQRGDSSVARKTEGAGLGLAISRKLMELHGGSLELRSEPGTGTQAIVTFPVSRLVAREAEAAAPAGDSGDRAAGPLVANRLSTRPAT